MKLVTLLERAIKIAPEYIPKKCNIYAALGRAIRLATGGGIVTVFLGIDLFALSSVFPWFRLLLFVPFYMGFLALLERTMSFCAMPAYRGPRISASLTV